MGGGAGGRTAMSGGLQAGAAGAAGGIGPRTRARSLSWVFRITDAIGHWVGHWRGRLTLNNEHQ